MTSVWTHSLALNGCQYGFVKEVLNDRADVVQVNLVATQLVLDREHPNRLVFSPSRGLDPLLDLRLRGAQVRPPSVHDAPTAVRVLHSLMQGSFLPQKGRVAVTQPAACAGASPDTGPSLSMAAKPHPDPNQGRRWRPGMYSPLHDSSMPEPQAECQKMHRPCRKNS